MAVTAVEAVERTIAVRRARPEDVPTIAGVLARAFDDDPVFRILLPEQRVPRLTRFFAAALPIVHLPLGEVWVTDDLRAAAAWAPPGRWHVSALQQLRMLPMIGVFGRSTLFAARVHRVVEREHPRDAHWYLSTLGVDPSAQGRGLGAAVLGPVLSRCDLERVDAYLESSNGQNHAFYRKQGFELRQTLDFPRNATVWTMRRSPRGA